MHNRGDIKWQTLVKQIGKVTTEGVSFTLTEPVSLNGGLSTEQWYVSWDEIGKALFGDQYSDAVTVKDLREQRGEATNEVAQNSI